MLVSAYKEIAVKESPSPSAADCVREPTSHPIIGRTDCRQGASAIRRVTGVPVIPFLFAVVLVLLSLPSYAALPLKPCRVLVLADAQARDGHVFRNAGELGDALGLLSLWGVPHDVLRLDTQTLREENLVGPSGQPLYGVIIWTVRNDLLPRRFQEGEVLWDACLKHHISLIAFGATVDVPAVQGILGLHPLGWREFTPPLAIGDSPHFITNNEPALPHLADEPWCAGGPTVKPTSPEVRVLLRAGDQPLMTVRPLDAGGGTSAIWLGGSTESLLHEGSGLGIRLFQRSLVWTLGAIVVHDYNNTLLLRMDDPGTAQSSYLRGWNYPSLTDSFIRQRILAPLREHHARLDVFCCPGYVDAKNHKILHSEQVDHIDAFGNRQDIRQTFTAMLEGQKEGLVEIESHGWTHFAPDLDTPIPGSTNWWAGTVSSEWADYRWYREFYDGRRNKDVPPDVQLLHMRTSCDWLERFSGRRPLVFCPPGHAVSGDSWIYPREITGTLEVRVEGAEPKALYYLFLGEDPDWIPVGELRADADGLISAALPAPAEMWLEGRGYFTINRLGGRTRFIAGPTDEALGFDITLPVRGKAQMTLAEQQGFPEASQSSCRGWITAHLNKETYQSPSRPAACTYQNAARAGFGLVIDTECHSLSAEQVTTLRMVPVVSSPRDIGSTLSRRADMPTVFRFHNCDLILNPEYLAHILKSSRDQGPPPTYLSADELTGYLHAQWALGSGPDNSLVAIGDFSAPACRYLRDHESTWTLLATDEVLSLLRGTSDRLVVRGDDETDHILTDAPNQSAPIRLHVAEGRAVHTLVLNAGSP